MKTILLMIFLVFAILSGFTAFDYFKDKLIGTNTSESSESTLSSNDNVDSTETFSVKLTGCISKKGTYSIESGAFLIDVITKAGGITDSADESCFDYYLVIESDLEIYIPPIGTSSKVSINDATEDELDELPGIGQVIAGRIVDYREEIGEFTFLEELMDISGFGSSLFNKVKDLICL